jgi:hypothetical protein
VRTHLRVVVSWSMSSGSGSGGRTGSFFSSSGLGSVGEVDAETDVGLEVEARAEGVVAVEEEEARGAEGTCASASVGDDNRLRLRQGLSSEARHGVALCGRGPLPGQIRKRMLMRTPRRMQMVEFSEIRGAAFCSSGGGGARFLGAASREKARRVES